MRQFNDPLIFDSSGTTSQVLSGTNVVSSSAVPLQYIEGFAVQAIFASADPTGSYAAATGLTGSVKLQACLDRATNVNTKYLGSNVGLTTWSDISGSTATIQISGSTSTIWNVASAYYPFFRVLFTGTAGLGSMSVRVSGKGA